jgi:predicted RNA-binding protein YlxR (DUF448 family)/ribosomal protein L30E
MERTCVGCHASAEANELVRLVLGPDGSLVADPRGGAIGRGAWVHPTLECVRRAVPRGVSHTLKTHVKTTADELLTELAAAGKRRALALIASAGRAKKAAAGATAVTDALEHGIAELVVVATDARAGAELPRVAAALEGAHHAVRFGTKAELGTALGRGDVGVVAILDPGISASLKRATALLELPSPRQARGSKDAIVTETG